MKKKERITLCERCRWTKWSAERRKRVYCRQWKTGIAAKAVRLCFEPRSSRSSKAERAPYKGEIAGPTPAATMSPNSPVQPRRKGNDE